MKESQIKTTLIDYLLSTNKTPLQFLKPEVRFADGRRRADLVIIDDYLQAFEIKSNFDNLLKLKDQVSDYSKCFEMLWIVTTKKHLTNVIKTCPKSIGILIIKNGKVTEFRTATIRKKLSKFSLLKMINSHNIKLKLKAYKGITSQKMSTDTARETLAKELKLNETIEFVKNYLVDSSKYNLNRFLNERGTVTSTDDLHLLTKTERELIPIKQS